MKGIKNQKRETHMLAGDTKMTGSNPYIIKTMIPPGSGMFFGRQAEMRRIKERLCADSPQSVSLIGERRIGKSSLAFRLFQHLNNSDNTIALFLDCDGIAEQCNSKDQFFQLLNQKAKEVLAERHDGLDLPDTGGNGFFDSYSSFKDFIKHCGKKKNIKTIIFIDEFEHLSDNEFADRGFFSNLRSMAVDPGNRLAFCTVSQKELDQLAHQSILTSNFWNIFDVEIIGLLDPGSIRRLRRYGFENTGFTLKEQDREKIHYYAGDFPFFNQMVCGFLWDADRDGVEPDWDKLEVKMFPHFKNLWDYRTREEQKQLKILKNKKQHHKNDRALKVMKSRGILIKEQGLYRPFSQYFSLLIDKNLEIKKEKLSEKEFVKDLKEVMEIKKKGKDFITG
jgi:hypothetical protein